MLIIMVLYNSEPSMKRYFYCCIMLVFVVNLLLFWMYVEKYRHVPRYSSENDSSVQQSGRQFKACALQGCSAINQVLFVKTHKTGSSTVTNILNRYGYEKNLSFVLPASGDDFEWPEKFRLSSASSILFREGNILCNHARFTPQTMHWLFPKDRSRYVTIVRDPVDQFESFFFYMDMKYSLGLKKSRDPLREFFTRSDTSFKRLKSLMKQDNRVNLIRNPMLFDLGLSFKHYQDLQFVQDYIRFLDKEFDLVMILEYFDESLVLLKRLLCWDTKDILYFKSNERLDRDKHHDISQSTKENISTWNHGDVLLYQYFNDTFWKKIQAEGPEFYDDLSEFRRQNAARKDMCLTKEDSLQEAYTRKYVKGHTVKTNLLFETRALCEGMTRSELSFLKFLRSQKAARISDIDKLPFESEGGWDR